MSDFFNLDYPDRKSMILPDGSTVVIWDVPGYENTSIICHRQYISEIFAKPLLVLLHNNGEVVWEIPRTFIDHKEIESYTALYKHAIEHGIELRRAWKDKDEAERKRNRMRNSRKQNDKRRRDAELSAVGSEKTKAHQPGVHKRRR